MGKGREGRGEGERGQGQQINTKTQKKKNRRGSAENKIYCCKDFVSGFAHRAKIERRKIDNMSRRPKNLKKQRRVLQAKWAQNETLGLFFGPSMAQSASVLRIQDPRVKGSQRPSSGCQSVLQVL